MENDKKKSVLKKAVVWKETENAILKAELEELKKKSGKH